MAPNLASNSSCVKLNLSRVGNPSNKLNVRTEHVLRRIYGHLLRDVSTLEYSSNLNESEGIIVEALKRLTEEFRRTVGLQMSDLAATLDVSMEAVESLFFGVSNELFSEGITWSRIAALLIFSSELTIQCLSIGLPDFIVEDVLNFLTTFTVENLQRWIDEHGSWESVVEFASVEKHDGNEDSGSEAASGWAKRALYGTVKVLGTLAYFANLTDSSNGFIMGSK